MRWLTLVCLPWALACGGPSEPQPPAVPQACKPPPVLAPVHGLIPGKTPPAAPPSRVGASLHVPMNLIERAIEQSVPVIVAEQRNMSAGAAGRTTFKIKRGEPRIEVTEAGLAIKVKLDGEIHLCKPFGGVCIAYGSCRPEWTAEVSARSPWQLRDEPEVTLAVNITKGCILSPVKVDVTSELKKVTDAEVAKIRKQLHREVRHFQRSLQKQLERATPLKPGPGECLTFSTDRVEVALDSNDDHYTLNVEATGQPGWDCSAPIPTQDDARVVTRRELTPKTELHVDSSIPLAALSAEWQRRLPHQRVQVTPGADDLLVEVAGWQGCTSGWVVFRPTHNGTLTLVATDTSDPALETLLAAPEVLAQTSAAHQSRTLRLMQSLLQPVTIESELLPHPLRIQPAPQLSGHDSAHIEPDALVLRTTLEGAITGKLTEKR